MNIPLQDSGVELQLVGGAVSRPLGLTEQIEALLSSSCGDVVPVAKGAFATGTLDGLHKG